MTKELLSDFTNQL